MRGGHQPYARRGARAPGAALTAMLRGASPFLPTPARLSPPPLLGNALMKPPDPAEAPQPDDAGSPFIRMPSGYTPLAPSPMAVPTSGKGRRLRR